MCVRSSTRNSGIWKEVRSCPGQPQDDSIWGASDPTLPSWLPWVLRKGCEQRTTTTYDILGTDAEGPADDIQDFLHRDGHGSPKLRAKENQSRETLSTGSPACLTPTSIPFFMMQKTPPGQCLPSRPMLPPALTHTPEHKPQAAGQPGKPLPKPEKVMGITIF